MSAGIRQHSLPSTDLTPRQREIVVLLGQGFRQTEIATRLGLTPGGVSVHLTLAKERLDIPSTKLLAEYARAQGWC